MAARKELVGSSSTSVAAQFDVGELGGITRLFHGIASRYRFTVSVQGIGIEQREKVVVNLVKLVSELYG